MWHVGFTDDPDPEAMRRFTAPGNEIPVAQPRNVLLARTDEAAVALTGVHVYTTGVEFTLVARVRRELEERVGHGSLHQLFWENGPGAGARFFVGVEFADGRRAANVPGPTGNAEIVFHSGSGGGGDGGVDQTWWLSPVPPEGPLKVVVRCDDLGIPETATELDGTALRRAMDDVVVLWPWEPPRPHVREPGPPADLPADSWFAG